MKALQFLFFLFTEIEITVAFALTPVTASSITPSQPVQAFRSLAPSKPSKIVDEAYLSGGSLRLTTAAIPAGGAVAKSGGGTATMSSEIFNLGKWLREQPLCLLQACWDQLVSIYQLHCLVPQKKFCPFFVNSEEHRWCWSSLPSGRSCCFW